MKIKDKLNGEPQTNSNVLIIVVSFLLLVSIAMSVLGIINGKSEGGINDVESVDKVNVEVQFEDETLDEMFQKEFAESAKSEDGYDLNDPFRETCAPVDGNQPATTSFTVCQPN